jgi:hypothetical protein
MQKLLSNQDNKAHAIIIGWFIALTPLAALLVKFY